MWYSFSSPLVLARSSTASSLLLHWTAVTCGSSPPASSPAVCFQPHTTRRYMVPISASEGHVAELDNLQKPAVRKRKVVEHILLLQMKEEFTDDQEKDMLDHLYTLQYQLRGIIAVSLGNSVHQNSDGCTHGLFMRFPTRETLQGYYDSPARMNVADTYIIPYYKDLICVDYESEVEDDIEPIFRRGEDFEGGVESIVLLQVRPDADPKSVQESLGALSCLAEELGMLVVQHTSGANFCNLSKGYTHGIVTRFRSEEAKNLFINHPSYQAVMECNLQPIIHKMLMLDYNVEPVSNTAL